MNQGLVAEVRMIAANLAWPKTVQKYFQGVSMGEWSFVDQRGLQNWKGGMVCMTCQHFIYGVEQHCHTMVGCNLRQKQKQLQQGQHLKKRCKLWAPN